MPIQVVQNNLEHASIGATSGLSHDGVGESATGNAGVLGAVNWAALIHGGGGGLTGAVEAGA